MRPNEFESAYLTVSDIAEHLSMSKEGVKKLMRKKVIPYHKLGHRTLRFKLSEVESALKRYRIAAIGDEGAS